MVVVSGGGAGEEERAKGYFNPLHVPLRTQLSMRIIVVSIHSILLHTDMYFFPSKQTTSNARLTFCRPFLSHAMKLI